MNIKGVATKKDFLLVSVIGATVGFFTAPILENIKLPQWESSFTGVAILVLGFVIFANFALWIASLVGRKIPAVWQFSKYAAIGAMNSALDLGIFNFLSLTFQVFSGPTLLVLNTISFMTAVTNSYFWNTFWSFKTESVAVASVSVAKYGKFLGVTVVGLAINSLIVYVITTLIAVPGNFTPGQWENVAKLSAVIPNLIWNFLGYKFFIFKPRS